MYNDIENFKNDVALRKIPVSLQNNNPSEISDEGIDKIKILELSAKIRAMRQSIKEDMNKNILPNNCTDCIYKNIENTEDYQIRKIDLFGVYYNFTYKSKERYQTSLGGLFILLFIIRVYVMGIYYFIPFMNRKNYTIVYYTMNLAATEAVS